MNKDRGRTGIQTAHTAARAVALAALLALPGCTTWIANLMPDEWLKAPVALEPGESFEVRVPKPEEIESCAGLYGAKFTACRNRNNSRYARMSGSRAMITRRAVKRDCLLCESATRSLTFTRMHECEKNGKSDWCRTEPPLEFKYAMKTHEPHPLVQRIEGFFAGVGKVVSTGALLYALYLVFAL